MTVACHIAHTVMVMFLVSITNILSSSQKAYQNAAEVTKSRACPFSQVEVPVLTGSDFFIPKTAKKKPHTEWVCP